jgi:hypothetical protein
MSNVSWPNFQIYHHMHLITGVHVHLPQKRLMGGQTNKKSLIVKIDPIKSSVQKWICYGVLLRYKPIFDLINVHMLLKRLKIHNESIL